LGKGLVVSLDVEGPIINPKFDFSWLIVEKLAKGGKIKDFNDRVKAFDEYDDNRWLRERKVGGHSTGTTPIISSLFAIAHGTNNEAFHTLAKDNLTFSPGATQLLSWLKNTKGIEPYFVSSAHPAAILPVAYQLEISSSHVFCNGCQLTQKEAETFDKKRREKPDDNSQTMMNEIRERFPYEKYLNSKVLRQFLDEYLEICVKINSLYAESQINEKALQAAEKEQLRILGEARKEDSSLAKDLKYLLFSEDGVMGAHKKKQALVVIEKREKVKKEKLVFIGDSIVDADPIAYAGHGISVNCTNKDALLSSRINLATPSLESLIPLLEFVISGKPMSSDSKEDLEKEISKRISSGAQVSLASKLFTADDIKTDMNAVMQANRLWKDYIKRLP
jgi:predicted HAD superfamily phosphohydrolase